jgi:RNA polymerase sigma-70 factor (ECF subfamily)
MTQGTIGTNVAVSVMMRERKRLEGYVWSIIGDRSLVEDVIQEVALLVVQKGGDLPDEARLSVWMLRAARFKSLAAIRKKQRFPMLFDDVALDRIEGRWLEDDSLKEGTAAEALHKCIERLTENNRRIINLRYGENLRSSEIAKTMSRKVGAIYKAIVRIHKQLAECIKHQLAEHESVPHE